MKKLSSVLLMIAAFCFCKSNFVTAQVNVQDSLALVDLYNSTDGPHWSSHTNWLTKKPVSTWFGIKVTNNRVTSINTKYYDYDDPEGRIASNNLYGKIPASLGNLDKLIYLDLSFNRLTDKIPSSLGNLIKLTNLNLDSNNLTNAIPTELGNLKSLYYLGLANNKLSGNIPIELANLSNIEKLLLSRNQLSGIIPPQLGSLANLTTLSLYNNHLSGNIPPELGNDINMKYLVLSDNKLSGNIPMELGNLSKLNSLYLDHNELSGNIPSQLSSLVNLYYLLLDHNQLSGKIPSWIGNFKNLVFLFLNNNLFSGNIPKELGNINPLWLYLNYNHLTGSIPAELAKLSNLQKLYLDHNQLSGSIPAGLGNLKQLMILYLGHNKLSGNIPAELGKIPHLQKLYLNNNQLTGKIPSTMDNLGSQCTIKISYNGFTFAGLLNLVRNHPGEITYAPQANIPLHQNGNILSVYTGGSYQLTLDTFKWYKDGSLMATIIGDSNFVVNEDGAYNVTVHNSVATKLTLYSDTINYTAGNNVIASKMNNNSAISVYPNPAKTNATISFSADGKYSIIVTDITGKILQTKTGVAIKGSNTIQLDVSNYASGMYLITIADEKNRKQTIRLSKE